MTMAEPMEKTEAIKGLSSALRVLQDPEFMRSERHQQQHWRANREGAHEKIVLFENRFITRMQKVRIPMFAHNMVRTPSEQMALYVQGVTKAPGGRSPHNYGCAVDMVHGVNAWDLTREQWRLIGHIGKEVALQNGIKVTWGGDFKSLYDPAHWELSDWRELAELPLPYGFPEWKPKPKKSEA